MSPCCWPAWTHYSNLKLVYFLCNWHLNFWSSSLYFPRDLHDYVHRKKSMSGKSDNHLSFPLMNLAHVFRCTVLLKIHPFYQKRCLCSSCIKLISGWLRSTYTVHILFTHLPTKKLHFHLDAILNCEKNQLKHRQGHIYNVEFTVWAHAHTVNPPHKI